MESMFWWGKKKYREGSRVVPVMRSFPPEVLWYAHVSRPLSSASPDCPERLTECAGAP